jgi:hypothetical protein
LHCVALHETPFGPTSKALGHPLVYYRTGIRGEPLGRSGMSQRALESAIGKLLTDDAFRGRFFEHPAAASLCAGLDLSSAELDALARIPPRLLAQLSASLDARICRLACEDSPRSAEADR